MDHYFMFREFMLQLCYAIILPQIITNKNPVIKKKNVSIDLQKTNRSLTKKKAHMQERS